MSAYDNQINVNGIKTKFVRTKLSFLRGRLAATIRDRFVFNVHRCDKTTAWIQYRYMSRFNFGKKQTGSPCRAMTIEELQREISYLETEPIINYKKLRKYMAILSYMKAFSSLRK